MPRNVRFSFDTARDLKVTRGLVAASALLASLRAPMPPSHARARWWHSAGLQGSSDYQLVPSWLDQRHRSLPPRHHVSVVGPGCARISCRIRSCGPASRASGCRAGRRGRSQGRSPASADTALLLGGLIGWDFLPDPGVGLTQGREPAMRGQRQRLSDHAEPRLFQQRAVRHPLLHRCRLFANWRMTTTMSDSSA